MLAGLLLVAALAENEALASATRLPRSDWQALSPDWSPWARRLSPPPPVS